METMLGSGNDKKNGEFRKSCREEKQRDAKMEDQVEKLLKSLGNSTAEQKISTLAKNVVELGNSNQRQTTILKQTEKSLEGLHREKDRLQIEYNKGVLIKHKLEQVCREQQKIMKSIKTESLSKIRDEEEKRKETQQHFQESINEIFTTLGKNNDENTKLKEANLDITKKFKYLAEQYEIREKQLMKTSEQINLSTQLNEAKLAKIKMESTIEREIMLKDKEEILTHLLSAKKLISDMQKREIILNEQLDVYTSKFSDFQSSLQKSNDVFETYKNEMSKMAKKIKHLEKDTYEWRSKYEKSTKAMLEMASDKTAQDQYVGKASRQLNQLQKLCRTLQAERASLLDVLKCNNIERPPMPELPPEPIIEPPPKSADKLDIMSRNCTELKKSLAVLQGQMNALTAEKVTVDSTVNESVAAKKSKNKKNKANKTCPIKDRSTKLVKSKEQIVTAVDSVHEETSVESDNIPDGNTKNATSNEENSNEHIVVPSITEKNAENIHTATADESENEREAEPILLVQNDVNVEYTKQNVEIDELVKDFESQIRVDGEIVADDENGGETLTPEFVAAKLNDDQSVPYPNDVSSN